LLLPLHECIRKEIVRKDVDVASRKAVEEAARQVEAVETKPSLKQ
jgi:hypothetical protein